MYKKLLNLFTIGSLLFKLVKLQFDALRGVGKDGRMATKPCNRFITPPYENKQKGETFNLM